MRRRRIGRTGARRVARRSQPRRRFTDVRRRMCMIFLRRCAWPPCTRCVSKPRFPLIVSAHTFDNTSHYVENVYCFNSRWTDIEKIYHQLRMPGLHHERRRWPRSGLVRRTHLELATLFDCRQWSQPSDAAVRFFIVCPEHLHELEDVYVSYRIRFDFPRLPLVPFMPLRFVESQCQGFSIRKPTLVAKTCAQSVGSFPNVAMSAGLEFSVSCPAGMTFCFMFIFQNRCASPTWTIHHNA